jgi:hypothetical protein
MSRALRKVERADGGTTAQLDDLFSFFQNCWHLKDWIKNDDTLPQATRDAIVKDAQATDSLLFCADLANGSKHLVLQNDRKGARILSFRVSTGDPKTGETFSEGHLFEIASEHGTPQPYGIVNFARKAVEDWEDLLKKHGLL